MDRDPNLNEVANGILKDAQRQTSQLESQWRRDPGLIAPHVPIQTRIPPTPIITGLPDYTAAPKQRPAEREDASGARILAVLTLLSAAGFLLAILVQGLLR